jgi:hypothetical protein
MVQPAESRQELNLAFTRRADFRTPTCWRVLRESKMSLVLVIVEQVGRHQPFEMALIQDDHVVNQVASATSTQRSATPLCHGLRKAVRVGWLPKRKRPNQALRQVIDFAGVRPFGEAQVPHIRETPVNRDDGKARLLTMHLVRVQITLQTFIGVITHD